MVDQATATSAKPTGSDNALVAFIPRVNIQAFCDDQRTAEAMQAAATDRRMTRAHVSIQLGGIKAAAQLYQSNATPDVLLVETKGARDVIVSQLMELAAVCQPDTKVIVIGHVNDVTLYRELIKQGVSEYMVAPLHQLQIIETIAGLYSDPRAAPVGKVIAFIGAKGGVGSSTIAHNVAWLMANRYATETVIVDFDLAYGTAGLNFNQESTSGMLDAIAQPERLDATLIDRLLTKLGDKLSLLSGPGGVDRDIVIETRAVEAILAAVRSSIPNVVLDLPNLWTPWVKFALLQADKVVITATPDLASLRNTKNFFDMLKQSRPNDALPLIVLNQFGVPKRPEIPADEFGKAIGTEIACVIPLDPFTFGTAQSNGQMLFEIAAKSKAADALTRLAQMITGTERLTLAPKSGLSSVFSKLLMGGKKK